MITAAICAFAIAVVSGFPALRLLRKLAIVDVPSGRSSHTKVTLRGGGIAPALAIVITVIVWRSWALLPALVMCGGFGVVGFVDDVRSVSAAARLPAQILLALGLAISVSGAHFMSASVFGAALLVLCCVNAVNFMDGINGISAVWCMSAGLAWSVIGWTSGAPQLVIGALALVGAAAGFLPFNFPRPQVFLGDVGSYFLGAWSAALVLYGLHFGIPALLMFAPLGIYAVDTSCTFVSRLVRGERVLQAHREHVYQRLVNNGLSHGECTAVVAALTIACWGVAGLVMQGGLLSVLAVMLGVTMVAGYLTAPLILAERGTTEEYT